MESIAEKYAAFAKQLRVEDLPPDVKERVSDLILDSLGVGIAGCETPPVRMVRKCMAGQSSFEDATAWGTREKSSIYGAALINGTSCHAYDYDDTHNWADAHISAVLVPCVLALGEKFRISGRKIIEAYTAGYEVEARIGIIGSPKIMFGRGFHCTGVLGPFGASIASGLLMGLNELELSNALGIAGSFSSGLMECMYYGSMTKRVHPGIASWHGMTAASLAKEGFTGPPTIIEGQKGYLSSFSGDFSKVDLATKGLGEYFEILETHIKIYACVSGFSGPIECLLTIMKEHGIEPEQIENIVVGVRELTYMCSTPSSEEPKNILSGQLSLSYCLAVAAYDKDVKLAQFSEEKLKDPRIISLMHRIKVSPEKDLTELNLKDTGCLPGRVSVKTRDGRVFKHQVNYAKDSRGNRASRNELEKKFLELSRSYVGDSRAQEIIRMSYDLEGLDDVGKMVKLCQAL
jgi:aconitate decarboxylase